MSLLFTRASGDFATPPVVVWGGSPLFVCVKFRLASLPSVGEGFVFEDLEVGSGGLINRVCYINNDSGTYNLGLGFTAGIFGVNYTAPITIAPNVWYQAAILATPPGTALMWLDETSLAVSLSGPADQMPGYSSVASVAEIGGRFGFSNAYFDGELAEMFVGFDAWTEEEIVALSRGVSPIAFYATHKSAWGYYYSFKGGSLIDPTDKSPGPVVVTGAVASDHPPTLFPAAMSGVFKRNIVPGVKFFINGTEVTEHVGKNVTPKLTLKQGERSTGSLTLHPDASLPSRYDDVKVIARDGYTRLFAGLIDQVTTRGIEPGADQFWKDLRLVDYSIELDWAIFRKTYVAPFTLQQLLIDMESQTLSPDYGIAIDILQDTGDTFQASADQPVVFDDFVGNIMRTVMGQCVPPRISRVSPYKRYRVYIPGTLGSTPVVMSDADMHGLSFEWTTPNLPTANYISLLCGGSGQEHYNNQWDGDGVTTSFEVDVPAVPAVPAYFVMDRFDGIFHHYETVSEPGNIGTWWWDTVLGRGTIYQNPGLGNPPPAVTDVLTYTYLAQFPYEVIATTGAIPKIAYRASTDEKNRAKNQLTADGLLAKLNQTIRNGTLITLEAEHFIPGQVMPGVTCTARNVSNRDFTMGDVNMEFTDYLDPFLLVTLPITAKRVWLSTIAMTETTVYQGSYLDQARSLLGGGGRSTAVGGGSGSPTPSPRQVVETDFAFSDITTADSSTSKHGLLPKLSGSATDALRGDGTFGPVGSALASPAVPPGLLIEGDGEILISIPGSKGDPGDPGSSMAGAVQMVVMPSESEDLVLPIIPASDGVARALGVTDGDIAGFDGTTGARLKDLGTVSTLLDGLTI